MGKVQVETDIPQTVNYVATSVTIGTTTILEPNAPATVTNSGTAQNAILNFGIPSTSADFSGYRTAAAQDIIDATKQPKTLSTAITVNGVSKATVEDALNAINENSSIADTDLSNLTATGEAKFNAKAETDLSNCTKPYIKETYHSGSDWYRIWSDNWCEQGGLATSTSVSLLKPMADTNYTVMMTQVAGGSAYAAQPTSITTTGFTYTQYQGVYNAYWEVKGYIS